MHEGRGRRTTDPLRTRLAMKPSVTTNNGNGRPEKYTFEDPREEVKATDEVATVLSVLRVIDTEDDHTEKVAADDPHEIRHDGQGRNEQHAS